MTIHDALKYELHSSWWAKQCGWEWLRDLGAAYLTRKTNRKWARYQTSIEARREVEELRAEMAKRRADLVSQQ